MSANLVLYGMMGAGKTTIGRALAELLGRAFADTDAEIAGWIGKSIPEIFATEGEEAFRAYESEVVRKLATYDDLVLALGGGTVLDDTNVADLSLSGVLIELRATPEVLVGRLQEEADGRPLLAGQDLTHRVRQVLGERGDRYAEVADLTLDANLPVEEVIEQLTEWLLEHPDVLTPSEYERLIR